MTQISSIYHDIIEHFRNHGCAPSWATRQQVQEVFDSLQKQDEEMEYALYEYLMRAN